MEARAAGEVGGLAENSFACALQPPLPGQFWGRSPQSGEQAPRSERGLPAASVVGRQAPQKEQLKLCLQLNEGFPSALRAGIPQETPAWFLMRAQPPDSGLEGASAL